MFLSFFNTCSHISWSLTTGATPGQDLTPGVFNCFRGSRGGTAPPTSLVVGRSAPPPPGGRHRRVKQKILLPSAVHLEERLTVSQSVRQASSQSDRSTHFGFFVSGRHGSKQWGDLRKPGQAVVEW